ncbi:hypothetical protein KKF34_18815 [Myxococcota bacterium]|nr:hypothetical protein [Myxococcota bacterium]MBU1380805.1 hypothetical protein [Myxococcota bacterium]MBU1498939.1 hypothetical protein [Myxococcota bacterium]
MKYIFLSVIFLLGSCSLLVSFDEDELNNINNSNNTNNTNSTNNTTTNNNNTNNTNNINGEICWNLVDDDGDTSSDCDDDECSSHKFCAASDSCISSQCNLISCRWSQVCETGCNIAHSYWNTEYPGNCSNDSNLVCTFDYTVSTGVAFKCINPPDVAHYGSCTGGCPKGDICLNNRCLTICSEDNPYCPAGVTTDLQDTFCLYEGNESTVATGLGYCAFAKECNLALSDCPDDHYCRIHLDDQVWKTYCSAYRGTIPTGNACLRQEDCQPGNICHNDECRKTCTVGENSECINGETCQKIGTTSYGFCLPL